MDKLVVILIMIVLFITPNSSLFGQGEKRRINIELSLEDKLIPPDDYEFILFDSIIQMVDWEFIFSETHNNELIQFVSPISPLYVLFKYKRYFIYYEVDGNQFNIILDIHPGVSSFYEKQKIEPYVDGKSKYVLEELINPQVCQSRIINKKENRINGKFWKKLKRKVQANK